MKNTIKFHDIAFIAVIVLLVVCVILPCSANGQVSEDKETIVEVADCNCEPIYITKTQEPEYIYVEIEQEKSYTDEELDWLSRIIYAEAGSNWIPDWVQLYAGSVILNRVESPLFPNSNTIYEVIHQNNPIQYSPAYSGAINNTPDERTIENARKLLEVGSVLPANVIFQAEFKQGSGVFVSYYDSTLKTTTYFCYKN